MEYVWFNINFNTDISVQIFNRVSYQTSVRPTEIGKNAIVSPPPPFYTVLKRIILFPWILEIQ